MTSQATRILSEIFQRTPRITRGANRRRGLMLILVLWITAVMSILAYSVIYQMTLETRLTSTRKKTLQAKALARAGLARGFVDLRNDMIFDRSVVETPPFDALGDVWADPNDGKRAVELERDQGYFDVDVVDEERYFNVNQFNASRRLLLEKIIQYIGYEEEDARIVASAIIDYADADEQAVLDSSPGNEGLSYGIIKAEDEGLSTRERDVEHMKFPNEAYLTVEALLDVYGVTPELYFGPGTPEAEYFRQKMGPQIGDRFQIERRRRRRSEEIYGLRDFFTVHGSGSINMNTAPKHVLSVLIASAQGGIDSDRIAETIIKTRPGGQSRRRVDNDNAFKTINDLQKIPEIAGLLGPMQAFAAISTTSVFFTLTSTGHVGDVTQTLSVTVRRDMYQLQRNETFEAIDRARERLERLEKQNEVAQDDNNANVLHVPAVQIIEWRKS